MVTPRLLQQPSFPRVVLVIRESEEFQACRESMEKRASQEKASWAHRWEWRRIDRPGCLRDSLDWEILRYDIQPGNIMEREHRSHTWRSFGNRNINVTGHLHLRLYRHLFHLLPPIARQQRCGPHTFDCELRLLSFLKGPDCRRQAIDRAKGVWQHSFYWSTSARVQLVLTRCVMCS